MEVQFSYREKFDRLIALDGDLERMQHILAQFNEVKAAIISQQRGLTQLELAADIPDDGFGRMIYNLRSDSQESLSLARILVQAAADAVDPLAQAESEDEQLPACPLCEQQFNDHSKLVRYDEYHARCNMCGEIYSTRQPEDEIDEEEYTNLWEYEN